ncbi:MAG: heat-inducible transcriptional repressor HrcA [Candidatus Neomarinimicrobiota bacterium]
MRKSTQQLSEREGGILAATIKDYIRTAHPVASARVRDAYKMPVSSATIRNTMAALERAGYLTHPHTSAGKVPTDKGYRTYVNQLMVVEDLSREIAAQVRWNLDRISGDVDKLLQIVANIISRLSGGVGIAIAPVNMQERLLAIRLVPMSGERVLMALELNSGHVRTVVAQGSETLGGYSLVTLEEILNERLSGLTLEEIQATLGPRLEGTIADEMGITTLILEHSDELFHRTEWGGMHIYGLQQVLTGPEFIDQDNVVTLISLVEDEGRLQALLLSDDPGDRTQVTIGQEHHDEQLVTFTTISRGFFHAASMGTVAVLAPKRIDYPQVFTVLEFLGDTLTELMERSA